MLLSAFALLLLFSACKKNTDPYTGDLDSQEQADAKDSTLTRYAALALAAYEDNLTMAMRLDTRINTFLSNPTQRNLDTARQAWIDARAPYSRSEVFRFYDGPIDGEGGPEKLINSWPLDENLIDYVAANQFNDSSSIIADSVRYPDLSPQAISDLNGVGGEKNITTGWHAIEFLLWGQDLSADGPGNRPVSDYYTSGNRLNLRRATYLRSISSLLITNLTTVRDAWRKGAPYYESFTKPANVTAKNDNLGKIFRGMGALAKGETGGERTRVPLASHSQEDEQSCFSDNTRQDIVNNVQGILDTYVGARRSLDGSTNLGPSPYLAIYVKDKVKATAAGDAIQAALNSAMSIPNPFDQAIINNTAPIQATADNLSTAADRLVDAAAVYKISVSTKTN